MPQRKHQKSNAKIVSKTKPNQLLQAEFKHGIPGTVTYTVLAKQMILTPSFYKFLQDPKQLRGKNTSP